MTVDLGPSGSTSRQHGRTSEDRWPDGFPAAPGSLNYQATTYEQRDAQRQARWVAAMDRSGVDLYWFMRGNDAPGVPDDPAEPYAFVEIFNGAPETPGMTELRSYSRRVRSDGAWAYLNSERPPAHVIWSYPSWYACEGWLLIARTDHAPMGRNTTSCELAVDWTVWVAEQYTDPALAGLSEYDRMRAVWHRYATVIVTAMPRIPDSLETFAAAIASREPWRLADHLESTLNDWLAVDSNVTGSSRDGELNRWAQELVAGRRPWETAQ